MLRRLYILDDAAFPLDYVKDVLGKAIRRRPRLAGPGQYLDLAGASSTRRQVAWPPARSRRPRDQAVWRPGSYWPPLLATWTGPPRRGAPGVSRFPALGSAPSPSLVRVVPRRCRGRESKCSPPLLAEEPGNATAWARLAELALDGEVIPEAEAFRKRRRVDQDPRTLRPPPDGRWAGPPRRRNGPPGPRAGTPGRGPRLVIDRIGAGRNRVASARSARNTDGVRADAPRRGVRSATCSGERPLGRVRTGAGRS